MQERLFALDRVVDVEHGDVLGGAREFRARVAGDRCDDSGAAKAPHKLSDGGGVGGKALGDGSA